jgi:hypothetical protein
VSALRAAIIFSPQLIWFADDGDLDPAGFFNAVQLVASRHIRINTTTKFCNSPEAKYYMWLTANLTGGICLDQDGAVIQRVNPTLETVGKAPAPISSNAATAAPNNAEPLKPANNPPPGNPTSDPTPRRRSIFD